MTTAFYTSTPLFSVSSGEKCPQKGALSDPKGLHIKIQVVPNILRLFGRVNTAGVYLEATVERSEDQKSFSRQKCQN